jgi:single-stranded-DNA-specific exonuclease
VQSRVEGKLIGGKPPGSFTRQSRWIIAPPEEFNGGPISWNEVCGSECIARLLMRKGFTSTEEVQNFLRPRLKSLSDPFLLPNMEAAVARVITALDRDERIVIFGDYDVDGVTSLALLAEALRAYGCTPKLFLPLRLDEGYGLSRESVDRCTEQHDPQLLIAVDCGTSSVVEIADLAQSGVDVIVLDHHEAKSDLPNCVAIVNPKIDPESPFHYLCSVGIVFKLCHALLKRRPINFDLKSKLDLVALGTVADIVPLHGENRIFVQRGAIEIARHGTSPSDWRTKSTRPGLRRLIEVSGVRPPILPEHIGFRLGPRLNASGRLSDAQKSLQVLLTQDEAEAASLADFLDSQNRERQEIEKQIYLAAEEQIAREFDPTRDAAIVLSARGWHPGVLGIVASRISRKHHRPAIVIGFEENGTGKGSGRSIEGLNLVEALNHCSELVEKFGGHEMAAGLTIREEKIDAFAAEFRRVARELMSDECLQPCLRLDHELAFSDLNVDLLRWHEMLQPFGNGNPHPLFFARKVESIATRVVNDKHLILRLRQGNYHQRAVYFDAADVRLPPAPWDIAFRIRANQYEGETRLDMQIQAVRQAVPIP